MMKNNKIDYKAVDNIIFFSNGSIGDFLMVLYFYKTIRSCISDINFDIIVPRNKNIFEEISKGYNIKIYESNFKRRGLGSLMHIISSFITKKNICITPSTPGKIPFHIKIIAWIMSRRSKSKMIGFDDHVWINQIMYDLILRFDVCVLYHESLIFLAQNIGFHCNEIYGHNLLDLSGKDDCINKYKLESYKYIVFHPCGSSKKRSFSTMEIEKICNLLVRKYPNTKIIMTGSKDDSVHIGSIKFETNNVVNLAGLLAMDELISIISFSAYYLGVDTGITHLACCMSKKSLVISHEASVYYWLPFYNKNAEILYYLHNCPHSIFEGLQHVKSCYDEEDHYFEKVPFEILLNKIEETNLI